jgi:hypothetical protein
VRIWLANYNRDGRISSDSRFFLFTTAVIAEGSFLRFFLENATPPPTSLAAHAREVLYASRSQTIAPIRDELDRLEENEFADFLSRIVIFDGSPRVTEVPQLIMDQHLRTIRRESRVYLFERLEGWWMNLVIKILSGERRGAVFGYEVSDKLSALAEEYRSDNLPITFRNKLPDGKIDIDNDPRLFVDQLRFIGVSPRRHREDQYPFRSNGGQSVPPQSKSIHFPGMDRERFHRAPCSPGSHPRSSEPA